MGVVGNPVFHPSDLSRVPGRVIERKTVQVFSLRTCLVEERFEMVHYAAPGQKPKWGYFPSDGHPEVVTRLEGTKATPEFLQSIAYVFIGMFIGNELKSARFKDTVHQVCVAHGRNNFVKAWNQGHKPNARLFVEYFDFFYGREASYKSAGLTPGEITRERQGLATKEVLISLRSLLDRELSDVPSYRSPLYTKALNYLRRFWDGMFAFLSDGELPIDNNLAERTIRKLTTQRNNSFHYGGDLP